MLTDSIDDFFILSLKRRANRPALLSEFEAELNHYSDKEWGYSPKVFPLLRKAARGYVSGKLSRQAMQAVCQRTLLCYIANEGSEEELIEDLRGYIRTKPSIDLCAMVERILSSKATTSVKLEPPQTLHPNLQHRRRKPRPTKLSGRTATTSTGVVLRLVK